MWRVNYEWRCTRGTDYNAVNYSTAKFQWSMTTNDCLCSVFQTKCNRRRHGVHQCWIMMVIDGICHINSWKNCLWVFNCLFRQWKSKRKDSLFAFARALVPTWQDTITSVWTGKHNVMRWTWRSLVHSINFNYHQHTEGLWTVQVAIASCMLLLDFLFLGICFPKRKTKGEYHEYAVTCIVTIATLYENACWEIKYI